MQLPPIPKAMTTGLSGNEMYCLNLKGYAPGNLVIGNSVVSLGILRGIASGLQTVVGGEVTQVTQLIQDGRERSFQRMQADAQKHGAAGITGVTSELISHQGNIEFLSIGSCIHHQHDAPERTATHSTSADGQALYCQLDCGFEPKKFVFGNVAYSIGVVGGLLGIFRSLGRGEVKEYSQIFRETRGLALKRITDEAARAGANAVVGIETSILPFIGMQEMLMIGTASHHPLLKDFANHPITSDLTNEEMWNLCKMGYMPLQLVMGVSVYSLGLAGGIITAFKSLVRTELVEMTTMIYEARENALAHLHTDAARIGADAIMGVQTYVYDLGGGILEFLAIGTAVKRMQHLTTHTPDLPPQAIIRDRDTFVHTIGGAGLSLNDSGTNSRRFMKGNPRVGALGVLIIALLLGFNALKTFNGQFSHEVRTLLPLFIILPIVIIALAAGKRRR